MFSVNVSRISESKMWRFTFLIFAAVLLSAAKGINSVKSCATLLHCTKRHVCLLFSLPGSHQLLSAVRDCRDDAGTSGGDRARQLRHRLLCGDRTRGR